MFKYQFTMGLSYLALYLQELEEPSSQESTNYDVLVSTIVKPKCSSFVGDIGGGDTEVYTDINWYPSILLI